MFSITIFIHVFFIIVLGANQFILLQFITNIFESLVTAIFMITVESCLGLFIILIALHYLRFKRYHNSGFQLVTIAAVREENIDTPELNMKTIFAPLWDPNIIKSGIFNILMILTSFISSKPTRTPPFLQAVLMSGPIILSVIFTKKVLKKQTIYDKKYIVTSLIFLAITVTLPAINMVLVFDIKNETIWWTFIWIAIFISSLFFRSLFSIYMEKYFIELKKSNESIGEDRVNDIYSDLIPKVGSILFSNAYRIPILLVGIPIEYFLIDSKPLVTLARMFSFTVDTLLFQIFVGVAIILFILGTSLNKISSNYNMITTTASGPVGALFFLLFSNLDPGLHFSWYIVMPTLICNVLCIGFWIKGEKIINKNGVSKKVHDINEMEAKPLG